MSYEVRIGILAVISIALAIWGYTFMKGKNLLSASNTYYVEYDNVDELAATSPVLIKGLRVGSVAQVNLSDDMSKIIVTLDIERDIRFPKGTEALIVNTSIMGGKAVILNVDRLCSGDDCAPKGSYLPGRVQGLFESMLGSSDVDTYVQKVKTGLTDIVTTVSDTLMSPDSRSDVAVMVKDLKTVMNNLASITSQMNSSMSAYDRKFQGIATNLDDLTAALAGNSEDISQTLANLNALSTEFRDAEIGKKAGDAMKSADDVANSLQTTLSNADKTLGQLDLLIADMNSGQGTMGMLMKDEQLYNNLNETARNLDLLLQDFRLNPKRYVNVSVFGKKQKEYTVPEDDPAEKQN